MQKMSLAGIIAVSTAVVFLSGGPAQAQPADHDKMCEALFTKNKEQIETLARAGNTVGIRSIFARGGCSEAEINVPSSDELHKPKARVEVVTCTVTFHPFKLTCTLGGAMPTNVIPNQNDEVVPGTHNGEKPAKKDEHN